MWKVDLLEKKLKNSVVSDPKKRAKSKAMYKHIHDKPGEAPWDQFAYPYREPWGDRERPLLACGSVVEWFLKTWIKRGLPDTKSYAPLYEKPLPRSGLQKDVVFNEKMTKRVVDRIVKHLRQDTPLLIPIVGKNLKYRGGRIVASHWIGVVGFRDIPGGHEFLCIDPAGGEISPATYNGKTYRKIGTMSYDGKLIESFKYGTRVVAVAGPRR